MLSNDVLNVLCCPLGRAMGRIEPLRVTEGFLVGRDSYPIIGGVPHLRLCEARNGTSYDNILCELAPRDQTSDAAIAEKMQVNPSHLRGKRVLVAGVGLGTELDIAL